MTYDERLTMNQKAAGFSGGLSIREENAQGVFQPTAIHAIFPTSGSGPESSG